MKYNDTFMRFGGLGPVEKAEKPARPPGPRVVEIDGDQDSLARVMESDDPAASFRPGYTTDEAEEGECLVRPVGKSWSDEARAAALEARGHSGVSTPATRGSSAASADDRHRGALGEYADDMEKGGNKVGAALARVGLGALSGQAVPKDVAVRAHSLLEEHESDAEKDGNQARLGAIRAARGALSRYAKDERGPRVA